MRFVQFAVVPFEVPSGTAFLYVALDTEGELWWLDSDESMPGPRWHPLPTHPGLSKKAQPRRRRR